MFVPTILEKEPLDLDYSNLSEQVLPTLRFEHNVVTIITWDNEPHRKFRSRKLWSLLVSSDVKTMSDKRRLAFRTDNLSANIGSHPTRYSRDDPRFNKWAKRFARSSVTEEERAPGIP